MFRRCDSLLFLQFPLSALLLADLCLHENQDMKAMRREIMEGRCLVVESKNGYYSLTNEFVEVMIMTKMLLRRANKLDKAGVTVISDMGTVLPSKKNRGFD
jgi:hypothetical protein